MGYFLSTVAAATATVGYDLMQSQLHQSSPVPRSLQGVSLTGSATIGDTLVDLYIDTVKVAQNLPNTKLGVGNRDDMMDLPNLFVPAGANLHAIVTDAPATNPVFLILKLQDLA